MILVKLFTLSVVVCYSSISYSQDFDVASFANYVGTFLKKDLGKYSYNERSKVMNERLNAIPILSIFEKLQNNPLIRKTDYWTAIPFIPENLQPSSSVQNYYAAYFWIGMEIDLKRFDIRSGYCKEESPLNLVDLSEEQLIELITPYLEKVENLDTPRFDCKNPRINSDGSSITGSVAGGNLSKREILEYGYQYLHVATPLFLEIIKLPSASLSQKDLFNLAYKLYENAWTAIGVISMMSAWESLIDRPGASMLASKVQPIIKNTNDMTGTTYHFWNYFTRGILFQSGFRDSLLSWGYETVWQGDLDDRQADKIGIEAARIVREILNQKNDNLSRDCIKVDKVKVCSKN